MRMIRICSASAVGYRFAPFEVSNFKVTLKLGVRAHYGSGDDDLESTTFHNFTAAYPPRA